MARASHPYRHNLRIVFFLTALGAPLFAAGQTPAARMMPDGSKDMYVGLGIKSAAKYSGSDERKTNATALIQMQWSNGVFLSGLSAGMHLSGVPSVEYGPLLAIEAGRNASGAQKLSGVGDIGGASIGAISKSTARFTDIPSRPVAGGFLNYYLDESLRLTSSLLYGSGHNRDGLMLNAGVQKSFPHIAPHHRLSLAATATWANRNAMQDYYGVVPAPDSTGSATSYLPAGGLRDVQLSLNWNWELSNLWLLTSQVAVSRLMGPAADSPLTDRRTGASIRTGLAYRF